MDKILTVVVPTYNMEKYLRRCLDSLIVKDQSLFEKLEVLVINDGSKDSSSAIAHEYQDKYLNVFRVIDKENGNYGSCINRGLKEATGKYIKILDADDYFDTSAFINFLRNLGEMDVDMVLTDMTYFTDSQQYEKESFVDILPNHIYQLDKCGSLKITKLMMHIVCYKVQLLRDHNYVQTEGISYTDQEWIFYPFFYVRSICYLKENLYQYYYGREGQTMNFQTMIKNVEHNKVITKRAFNFYRRFDRTNLPVTNAIEIERNIRYMFNYLYNIYLKQQGKNYDKTSLREIDDLLSEDKGLYFLTGRAAYHKYLPIPYISIWRKFGWRVNLDCFLSFYHKIKS